MNTGNGGNAGAGLDLDHIITVCMAAVPAMPQVDVTLPAPPGAASGPVAGGASDEPRLTLAYEDPTLCQRADDALNRCGYATATGRLSDSRLYGIQVAGWSTGKLERRSTYLRQAAATLGTTAALRATATRAIEAAARLPLDSDPRTAGYHVAVEVTERMARAVVDDAGPLASLTVFPSAPHLRDLLRTTQRRADRVATIINDHFGVAGIAADAYLHIRHLHAGRPTGRPAQVRTDDKASADTTPAVDLGARREAWAHAHAFIAAPFDADAMAEASAWAKKHHRDADPAAAAEFALSYARDCHGIDRAHWPALEKAYQAWNEPPAAPRIAGADFPYPPGTTATAAPAGAASAQDPAAPRRGLGPRKP